MEMSINDGLGDHGSPTQDEKSMLLPETSSKSKEIRKGTASVVGSIFNLTNSIVGAGLLAFPYAIRCTGLISGIIVVVCFVVCSGFTLHIVFMACIRMQKENPEIKVESYAQVVQYYLGPIFRLITELSLIMYTGGATIVYMTIIGDAFSPVMTSLFGDTFFLADRRMIILVSSVVAIFPLVLLRSVDSLKFTSILSLVSAGYLVLMIFGFWIKETVLGDAFNAPGVPDRIIISLDIDLVLPQFLLVLPIIAFAFDCHLVAPPIFAELKDPTMLKCDIIVVCSLLIVLLGYLATGMFGFLLFGDRVAGDILKSFEGVTAQNFVEAVAGFIARAAMGIVSVCSFPIASFVQRLTIVGILAKIVGKSNFRLDTASHGVISIVIFIIPLIIAIIVPSITSVIGFIGGFFATLLMFFLPGLMLLAMLTWHAHPSHKHGVLHYVLLYVFTPFLMIFSALLFLIGPLTNVFNIIVNARKK